MIIIIVSSLFTRRAALEMWKQKLGSTATYSSLIGVFERAGYQGYADTVYKVLLPSQPLPPDTPAASRPPAKKKLKTQSILS